MEENVVCRTCLRPAKKYVSIFSAPELWGKNIVLAKLIMACAPVVVTIGDGLPTKICENCLQLLQLSFLFRLRVITASENYKEMIRTQSSPRQQEATGSIQNTTNLNQIYSTEYIFNSIKNSVPSSNKIVTTVKREPLDIKKEIEDRSNEDSPSTVSSVIPNNQENQNSQTNKINDIKKQLSYRAKLQNKNKSTNNTENTCNNLKSTNNNNNKSQSDEVNNDVVFDTIEFNFPNVENSSLLENVNRNIIIGNEEQIDNELNLKLINNKQRIKRSYSKMSSSQKSPNDINSVCKTKKFKNNIKTDELEQKSALHNGQLIDSKNIKTCNYNLLTDINECIIIDD